ncbi:MAG: hypothetical protein Q9N34_02425 [Aquificota bacterium]|nr:hypothetical protein [Aquificota bacterium]
MYPVRDAPTTAPEDSNRGEEFHPVGLPSPEVVKAPQKEGKEGKSYSKVNNRRMKLDD